MKNIKMSGAFGLSTMNPSEITKLKGAWEDVFRQSPMGTVKFSALMRSIVDTVPMDEGQKNEAIFRLCRGFYEPKDYAKISPSLIPAITRDDSIKKASFDYGKCLLAKAMSVCFENSVSKFKNLAARRRFLINVANLSEVLHLESWDLLETRLDGFETGASNPFMSQVNMLLDQEWNPEGELPRKLDKAQGELSEYMKAMEVLTGFAKGGIGKEVEGLQVVSFHDPWQLENEGTKFWGTAFYPILNVLNIQPPYLYFDALRRGLIAREAARLFQHSALDRIEWIYEQSDYCAYKILEGDVAGDFWIFARHGLRKESKEFDGTGYYARRESIVGTEFLKEVFSRINSVAKFRPYIGDTEYQTILDMLALKPRKVKIDDVELKILETLAASPRASLTAISQRIGFTAPTTKRMIDELNRKTNLWFSVLVDINRIGLSEYFLLLKVIPGKEKLVADLFWEIPYCTKIHKTFGPMNLCIQFDLPPAAEDYLQQYLNQLRRRYLVENHALCKVKDQYYNINFRYYDANKSGWDVHWDEWGLWVKEFLFEKGWYYALYEAAKKKKETKLQAGLDKLDLQIVNRLILDARSSYTEIGRNLGITGVYVGQKTNRMMNQGIIQPIMGSYRIGLDEVALVAIDCDEDTTKALAVALNELPLWQGVAVTGNLEGLISMIFVPTGDIEQLFHIIDSYIIQTGVAKKCWLHMVGKWVSRRRSLRWLPTELYSERKGWIFEGEQYLENMKKRLDSST